MGDLGGLPKDTAVRPWLPLTRGALPTLLGCAWMERAVLTESTLKRKGRRPWKASLTLAPRQAGFSAIHWPRVRRGMRSSRMMASPRGCAPIQSCGGRKGGQTDRQTP